MNTEALVKKWFALWEAGDYAHLPLAENFTHTSPFGTIEGKAAYLGLVAANPDKFLGYRFKLHDGLYEKSRACVRYTALQNDFKLDVSEWYYVKDDLIESIVSYYHIGEIRDDRKLSETPS